MYNEYDVNLIWGKIIPEKIKMYHRINLKHKVYVSGLKPLFSQIIKILCVYHSGGFSMNSRGMDTSKIFKS